DDERMLAHGGVEAVAAVGVAFLAVTACAMGGIASVVGAAVEGVGGLVTCAGGGGARGTGQTAGGVTDLVADPRCGFLGAFGGRLCRTGSAMLGRFGGTRRLVPRVVCHTTTP